MYKRLKQRPSADCGAVAVTLSATSCHERSASAPFPFASNTTTTTAASNFPSSCLPSNLSAVQHNSAVMYPSPRIPALLPFSKQQQVVAATSACSTTSSSSALTKVTVVTADARPLAPLSFKRLAPPKYFKFPPSEAAASIPELRSRKPAVFAYHDENEDVPKLNWDINTSALAAKRKAKSAKNTDKVAGCAERLSKLSVVQPCSSQSSSSSSSSSMSYSKSSSALFSSAKQSSLPSKLQPDHPQHPQQKLSGSLSIPFVMNLEVPAMSCSVDSGFNSRCSSVNDNQQLFARISDTSSMSMFSIDSPAPARRKSSYTTFADTVVTEQVAIEHVQQWRHHSLPCEVARPASRRGTRTTVV